MPPQGPSPALFFDTMGAYQRTEALRAAIELDLFSLLAPGRQTATELANACQAAPRGIRILADHLAILGFLHKHDDRYELTADSRAFLDRESAAYVGGAVGFLLAPELRESFQQLTGGRAAGAARRSPTKVPSPTTTQFGSSSPRHGSANADAGPVACGPGWRRYGTTAAGARRRRGARVVRYCGIADRYRQAHITALDLSNVLAVAAENAQRAGVAEHYALRPGSAFEVDWGGPYDIVLLPNFLHHFDVPTCEQLAAKGVRGSRTGRPSTYARIHPRARSHHTSIDRRLRGGDARHHGPWRRLYVCGIPGCFCPVRVHSQRVLRASADDSTGRGIV